MKRFYYLSLVLVFFSLAYVNVHACMNEPLPPPDCPEPECANAGGNPGVFLKWVIEDTDCVAGQVTVRFKNLSSMFSDTSHTCTCALGSTSTIFEDIVSMNFVEAGTNNPIASFANWEPETGNAWAGAMGFDNNYSVAGFTSGLSSNLADGQSMDIVAVLSVAESDCSPASIRAMLADVKLGVDEWDNATNQPLGNTTGQGHQSVTPATETCNCPAEYVGVERAQMMNLFTSLDFPNGIPANWGTNAPLNTWEGVTAVGDCYVTKIILKDRGITGTLPPILDLPYLVILNFKGNSIGGYLPNYPLECLRELNFHDNELVGPIPSFDRMFELRFLRLRSNHLTGMLPTLVNSPRLKVINVRSNCISGNIPNYAHVDLKWLRLQENKLTGNLPDFQLPSLEILNASNNLLTGAIPDFSGMPVLWRLRLHKNCLDDLPDTFTNLPALVEFYIQKNKFDFGDLEPFILNGNVSADFRYHGQGKILIDIIGDVIRVYAGGTIENNTYKWFKDGALYETIEGDRDLPVTEAGEYYAKVTNINVPGLTLTSETILFEP